MAKKRGKPKDRKPSKPPKARLIRIREDKLKSMLREVTREAAHVGLATAIEHCANFWTVSDGYKKYIDHQIATQSEALMAAVRTAVRDELTRVVLPGNRRRK